MNQAELFLDTHHFLMALSCTQARTLAMFAALPIFNPQLVPGMLRLGVGAGMGLVVAHCLERQGIRHLGRRRK